MLTYKVAIIGAGPAGYFAAQALQNLANDDRVFEIDMIERLPTPWGLVRSGVAPCLLYTSPSPRDRQKARMPSSA